MPCLKNLGAHLQVTGLAKGHRPFDISRREPSHICSQHIPTPISEGLCPERAELSAHAPLKGKRLHRSVGVSKAA